MVEVVKTEREKEEEKMNKMRREKRSHYVPHNAYVILGEEERVRRGQSDSPPPSSLSSSHFISLPPISAKTAYFNTIKLPSNDISLGIFTQREE